MNKRDIEMMKTTTAAHISAEDVCELIRILKTVAKKHRTKEEKRVAEELFDKAMDATQEGDMCILFLTGKERFYLTLWLNNIKKDIETLSGKKTVDQIARSITNGVKEAQDG